MDTIYWWFSNWFGIPLDDLMRGIDADGFQTGANCYPMFGFVTLVIALVIAVIYYYVINHPRFNRWWSWLIMQVICSITCLIYGIVFTTNRFTGMENVGPASFIAFGFANYAIAAIWFLLLSFIMKWGSRNCKHSPFL